MHFSLFYPLMHYTLVNLSSVIIFFTFTHPQQLHTGTQGTHSTAGVNEELFDHEKWNEVASVLHEIDESQRAEQVLATEGAPPTKPEVCSHN
jgi:hypothetical protein